MSLTSQIMKICIKDFFSDCDQIHSFLRIWSHFLMKSLMENLIFCVVPEMEVSPSRTKAFMIY